MYKCVQLICNSTISLSKFSIIIIIIITIISSSVPIIITSTIIITIINTGPLSSSSSSLSSLLPSSTPNHFHHHHHYHHRQQHYSHHHHQQQHQYYINWDLVQVDCIGPDTVPVVRQHNSKSKNLIDKTKHVQFHKQYNYNPFYHKSNLKTGLLFPMITNNPYPYLDLCLLTPDCSSRSFTLRSLYICSLYSSICTFFSLALS